MERDQRRQRGSGREHRPEASRRPYSDEQETYRNPRDEYRDDTARRYGDDAGMQQHGSSHGDDESDRYGAAAGGYAHEDHRDGRHEHHGQRFPRPERQRDTWMQPQPGNFSDERTRGPRDERYRSEPRSQNWPHSRTGGRVSEYGYFGDVPPGAGRSQPGPDDTSRRFDEDYSGRGPRNYSRSDERIKEDVCDELSADRECDAGDIDIEVEDGIVTLSGTVPSRRMKHRAEDIADAARGVKDVENRIRVTGRTRDDSGDKQRSEPTGSKGASQKEERQSPKSRR